MPHQTRRRFLATCLKSSGAALVLNSAALPLHSCSSGDSARGKIMTVRGAIEPQALGRTLPHEHVMVDFIGADETGPHRYKAGEVFNTMLPYMQAIQAQGVTGFIECTPMFLARDPEILLRLSEATGIHILTNTGMYKEPYLPRFSFDASADLLARQWTDEFFHGIDDTGIRPGFIKIAVFKESLKPMQQKIVRAACRTHNATGITIACHTGHGPAALQILDIFAEENTPANALIVVHLQGEKDLSLHAEIAQKGAWLEYDNIGSWETERHVALVNEMLTNGFEKQILLSQDRGWYRVGEPKGGNIKPFTHFFETFIPALSNSGVDDETIDQLTVSNPAAAFRIDV